MILNLMGPPGVGKSTFASRFILEHPYFKYCAIDAYRVELYDKKLSIQENEKVVWNRFYKDIYHAKDVVVESIGLDWKLQKIFDKIKQQRLDIVFIGDSKQIEERLRERQHKRRVNLQYNLQDEIDTISYFFDELEKRLNQCSKIGSLYVDATFFTAEEIYEDLRFKINTWRLYHLDKRTPGSIHETQQGENNDF